MGDDDRPVLRHQVLLGTRCTSAAPSLASRSHRVLILPGSPKIRALSARFRARASDVSRLMRIWRRARLRAFSISASAIGPAITPTNSE
jgi:hypothetical protein